MHKITYLLMWIFRLELPGWGRLSFLFNYFGPFRDSWKNSKPKIIRDKIHNKYRVLNLSEWADRSLYFLGRWYELDTDLVLRKLIREGDFVLDVGANYGHFTLAAQSYVGKSGQVIAVEPNPYSFGRLVTHLMLNKINNVRFHNIGLGSENSSLILHVPNVNSGEATFGRSKYDSTDVVEYSCQVRKGDELIGNNVVNFVKIDVEGFEFQVLNGLVNTIMRDKPYIYLECVEEHLINAGSSANELLNLMKEFGYEGFTSKLSRNSLFSSHNLTFVPLSNSSNYSDILWVHQDNSVGDFGLTSKEV